MMYGYGGWWVFGFLMFIIFWGAVIALIVWAIRRSHGTGSGPSVARSPLDIAKERYARGEISKDQFEQIKKDLMG